MKQREKGHFRLRDDATAPTNISMYYCTDCCNNSMAHQIVEEPGPPARGNQYSLPGDATTIRVCTGCNRYDGPWVPAPF